MEEKKNNRNSRKWNESENPAERLGDKRCLFLCPVTFPHPWYPEPVFLTYFASRVLCPRTQWRPLTLEARVILKPLVHETRTGPVRGEKDEAALRRAFISLVSSASTALTLDTSSPWAQRRRLTKICKSMNRCLEVHELMCPGSAIKLQKAKSPVRKNPTGLRFRHC